MEHGFLLVDKPSGKTSHDIVFQVRKKIRQKQVGHAGTLDPLATGLLVVLVGNATKLSPYILPGEKSYRAKIELGVWSDTLDLDCDDLRREEVSLSPELISEKMKELAGDFQWPVPLYSAVKVNGRKLYEYARAGETVERPIKRMHFYDMRIIEVDESSISFEVSCCKGSFIRSLAEQLGARLGVGAAISELRRVRSEPYSVESSVKLEDWDGDLSNTSAFIPMAQTLQEWPGVVVTERDLPMLRNGQISRSLGSELIGQYAAQGHKYLKLLSKDGVRWMALAELSGAQGYRVRRVFET